MNLRKTPSDSYRRATGKNPIPRFFKNCRATRVTELIKKEGFSQHSVCEWIGHTEEISNEHYLMMIEEDHSRATESKTALKTALKSAPTSETQNTPDSIIKQAFASLGDDQLDQLTLVLQGVAGVIETHPESAHLLLTAISDEAKKPQSSSNRGRKDAISDGKYRVGKVKGVKIGDRIGDSDTSDNTNTVVRLADLAHQRGTWKTMELLAGLLAANLIPK